MNIFVKFMMHLVIQLLMKEVQFLNFFIETTMLVLPLVKIKIRH